MNEPINLGDVVVHVCGLRGTVTSRKEYFVGSEHWRPTRFEVTSEVLVDGTMFMLEATEDQLLHVDRIRL